MHKRSKCAVLILAGLCFLAGWRLLPITHAKKEITPAPLRNTAPAVVEAPTRRPVHVARTSTATRDILPIFASRCYACHGPASESGTEGTSLRLDDRAEVVHSVIVPGNAGKSRLLRRLAHTNPARRMPPPGGNRAAASQQSKSSGFAAGSTKELSTNRTGLSRRLGGHRFPPRIPSGDAIRLMPS